MQRILGPTSNCRHGTRPRGGRHGSLATNEPLAVFEPANGSCRAHRRSCTRFSNQVDEEQTGQRPPKLVCPNMAISMVECRDFEWNRSVGRRWNALHTVAQKSVPLQMISSWRIGGQSKLACLLACLLDISRRTR
jgi:hypothetical protein